MISCSELNKNIRKKGGSKRDLYLEQERNTFFPFSSQISKRFPRMQNSKKALV